ncbi:MAG: hypothetical protein ACK5SL_05700 [Cyclobacteriaceae bacterium]
MPHSKCYPTMTKLLRNLVLSASACLALAACDNGNADVTVFDSPPAVSVIRPGAVTANVNFDMKLKFSDGADPSISSSALASATYKITQGTNTVREGSLSLSGVSQETATAIQALNTGNYALEVIAIDANNNRDTVTTSFRVVSSVALIGSATPNGWGGPDHNLTRSASDPDVYTISNFVMTSGFAKFRADDDWATNWGASTFPSGKGTFGGPDIPVGAGTYNVTFNSASGEYTFTKLN